MTNVGFRRAACADCGGVTISTAPIKATLPNRCTGCIRRRAVERRAARMAALAPERDMEVSQLRPNLARWGG